MNNDSPDQDLPPPKTMRICVLAQELAKRIPEFFRIKGAGDGDRATNEYMSNLRQLVKDALGMDFSEAIVSSASDSKFDFYIPDEATVIEVALSLRNSNSEYEKDVFKCLIAKRAGKQIERLMLLSKPGALAAQTPYRKAVSELAKASFGVTIHVLELYELEQVNTTAASSA